MESDQFHVPAFSDIARGQAQNPNHHDFIPPRLPQSVVYASEPSSDFRRNHVADSIIIFWPIFAEDYVADELWVILGNHRRNTLILDFQHAGQDFVDSGLNSVWQYWIPYIVFVKYLMWLLYKSNDLGWFACFRIQFLPDHIMIHSCLVCETHAS